MISIIVVAKLRFLISPNRYTKMLRRIRPIIDMVKCDRMIYRKNSPYQYYDDYPLNYYRKNKFKIRLVLFICLNISTSLNTNKISSLHTGIEYYPDRYLKRALYEHHYNYSHLPKSNLKDKIVYCIKISTKYSSILSRAYAARDDEKLKIHTYNDFYMSFILNDHR